MQSILNILTPAASPARFTTLATVKQELAIADRAHDAVLLRKIAEASDDVEKAVGFRVPSEGVEETFWHDHRHQAGYGYVDGAGIGRETTEILFLRRTPVSAIASVVVDDVTLDPSEYRLDAEAGLLYRLDSSGFPCGWLFSKSAVVAYTGGYVLPGDAGANLPPGLEGATVQLLACFWAERGRDPALRSEDVAGVRRAEYWVGATGDPDQLPPSVLSKLALFKRPRVAVA